MLQNNCREVKRKHASLPAAMKARKEIIKDKGDSGRGLQAYYCLTCHAWHLGHKPKKRKAA